MVCFITGRMNSGKTTRLLSTYKEKGVGEGFALIKVMKDSKVHSYRARRLSSGQEELLILRQPWLTESFDEVCRIGPYCFSGKCLSWIETTIREAVAASMTPIYLDEIGVLELQGQGYSELLKDLVSQGVELYLTTREDLLEDIVTCFNMKDYRVENR